MAERLQEEMDKKFWDTETESGYFIGSEQGDVKVRIMEDQDGAEPCANSVAVGNLIRLYEYFEKAEHKQKAEKIVSAASSRLIKCIPIYSDKNDFWISSNGKGFSQDNSYITERCPAYEAMLKSNGINTFVCANFTCGPPVSNLHELKSQLEQLAKSTA
ncbi:unnamed protein product [Strongylus vulgaris]|uniref:Uncharacterized protein n=1 Tax=Strongylus vulgaris TaxID=40348 RepID=A0A3P7JBI4_STRVU|nr:unnamed protein product [Strongylus vulgaris]